jgi:hypothetical protein
MVVEDVPADAQHHRSVPPDQGCEGDLGARVTPRRESLGELPVCQPDDGTRVEGDINLPKDHAHLPGHRGSVLLQTCFLPCNVVPRANCSILRDFHVNEFEKELVPDPR